MDEGWSDQGPHLTITGLYRQHIDGLQQTLPRGLLALTGPTADPFEAGLRCGRTLDDIPNDVLGRRSHWGVDEGPFRARGPLRPAATPQNDGQPLLFGMGSRYLVVIGDDVLMTRDEPSDALGACHATFDGVTYPQPSGGRRRSPATALNSRMTSPYPDSHKRNGGQVSAQRVVVLGAGYVGLTTSACLASLGHWVVCGDVDDDKVEQLRTGEVRILEPGLAGLVRVGLASGRLEFVLGATAALSRPSHTPDVVFVCVPTPTNPDGAADLTAVEATVSGVREVLPEGCVLAIKSTVPPGTAARVRSMLGRDNVAVVSNPEFLRESCAVADFLHPDRILIGSDDQGAAERVASLYSWLSAPIVLTDSVSAEIAKYAANWFLAMKLSYVNSVAEVCELLGADIDAVTESMGHDPRIGEGFLRPGPGWGGPCLPKDIYSFRRAAADLGMELHLVDATIAVNTRQQRRVVNKVRDAVGGNLTGVRVGLLGLSFKPGTADVRDSPALAVAKLLAVEGADLTAFDPGLSNTAEPVPAMESAVLTLVDDPYHVAKDADALVLLTDWPQFQALDWRRIANLLDGHVVVDTRNHLDPDILRQVGLTYIGMGKHASRNAVRTRCSVPND